jgi:hypothetical protein
VQGALARQGQLRIATLVRAGDIARHPRHEFPGAIARQTVLKRLLRIDNVTAGRAARAILSVLPLDSFVDKPAFANGNRRQARRGSSGADRGAE